MLALIPNVSNYFKLKTHTIVETHAFINNIRIYINTYLKKPFEYDERA
jgi:hypothetical protein